MWFNDAGDDGTLDTVQEYLMARLTYGDDKTLRVLQTLYADQTSSNTEYVLKKVFPSANALYARYNIQHKCFILIPFLSHFCG